MNINPFGLPGYGAFNFGFGFGLPFLGIRSMWAPFRQPPVVQPGLDPNAPVVQEPESAEERRQRVVRTVVGVAIFFLFIFFNIVLSQPRTYYIV